MSKVPKMLSEIVKIHSRYFQCQLLRVQMDVPISCIDVDCNTGLPKKLFGYFLAFLNVEEIIYFKACFGRI